MFKRTHFAFLAVGILTLAGPVSATTITIGSPAHCVPPSKTYTVPGSGSVVPVPWDVTQCPAGILHYQAGGGTQLGLGGAIATHIYSIILKNDASTGPIPITSGPYTVKNGFSVATWLDGFASYQGNPGVGQFSWNITITGKFLNGTSMSFSNGVITGSPQKKIQEYQRVSFPKVSGTDFFVSHLTVTTSGIGELHLERTGIASLAPIPLPASVVLLLGSLGGLSLFGRLGSFLALKGQSRPLA